MTDRALEQRSAVAAAVELVAKALGMLGSERAWVVHGADGLDEISTTGYTKVSEARGRSVRTRSLARSGRPASASCSRPPTTRP